MTAEITAGCACQAAIGGSAGRTVPRQHIVPAEVDPHSAPARQRGAPGRRAIRVRRTAACEPCGNWPKAAWDMLVGVRVGRIHRVPSKRAAFPAPCQRCASLRRVGPARAHQRESSARRCRLTELRHRSAGRSGGATSGSGWRRAIPATRQQVEPRRPGATNRWRGVRDARCRGRL